MRLDRFLAEAGNGTRSEIKKSIRAGDVAVNGVIERDPGRHVDPQTDAVTVRGRAVSLELLRYFLLNKPAGVVTATRDKNAGTVLDLIPAELRRGLYPVGRLDKDTEGLLLLTNDGPLGHGLLSPRRHVEKTYAAVLRVPLTEEAQARLAEGVDIGDETPTLPASAQATEDGCLLTIREGRYHQVKRMMLAVGNEVLHLRRVSMGGLVLDSELASGAYRPLTQEEVRCLYEAAGMPFPDA